MSKTRRPYFRFRVLLDFDDKHKVYVGYCLETGNVVTADDMETASDLMKEVLEDEASNAIKFENYSNLFSKPAPKSIWDRWNELSETIEPFVRELNIKNEQVTLDDKQTSAKVEYVGAQ
jgi:hypothetical protein